MRVLMLSWEYRPNVAGGLGRHVSELSPALVQQGVEVHVVTPATGSAEKSVTVEEGVVVHRVPGPAVNPDVDIYSRATEVNQILDAYIRDTAAQYGPYDLIHTHDWLTSFAATKLKQDWAIPLVATVHATERGRVRGHIYSHLQWLIDNAERDLINQAWQVIVCSRYMFNEVQYFFHSSAEKLDIVPNGVDISHLCNGHSPAELSAFQTRYAAPDDRVVFTIARLVYEKGIHLLIRAAPRILADCPQARIIIAGRGPEAENLQQQSRHLGVAERVNFIGFISDRDRNGLFEVAACAVFPSLYEPFGIVALEAMALGCPVVVSDVGGFSEMVKHTETGITVFSDNPDSVAWGVLHTLVHPDWAKLYAGKARQTVLDVFNWQRIAGLTLQVYHNVLAR